jgi:hypothetical protein
MSTMPADTTMRDMVMMRESAHTPSKKQKQMPTNMSTNMTATAMGMPMLAMPARDRRASVEDAEDADEFRTRNVGGEDVITDAATWVNISVLSEEP